MNKSFKFLIFSFELWKNIFPSSNSKLKTQNSKLRFTALAAALLAPLWSGGCLYRLLEPPPKPPVPVAREAWTHEMTAPVAVAPQALSGGRVAAMDAKGTFRILSLDDGRVLAEEKLPFEPLRAASSECDVAVAGKGTLILRCADGQHATREFDFNGETLFPMGKMEVGGRAMWVAASASGVHMLDAETGGRETMLLETLRAAHHSALGVGRASDSPDKLTGAAWTQPMRPGVLYAAAESGLYAIQLDKGKILWHRRMAGAALSFASRGKRRVYAGSAGKNIYALRAGGGRAAWRLQTGGKIAAPLVWLRGPQGGSLYAASYDLILYGLRAHGGHRLWNKDLPARADDLAWWEEARSLAMRPLFSSEILLFHPETGERQGVFSIPKKDGEDDYFTSSMTLADGFLVAGTYRGSVHAVRAELAEVEAAPR